MSTLEQKIRHLIFSPLPDNQQLGWLMDATQNQGKLRQQWARETRWLRKHKNDTLEELLSRTSLTFIKRNKYLNLPELPLLQTIRCNHLGLWELRVRKCIHLTTIDCVDNHLLELDLSCCPALEQLDCSYNPLKRLDVSHCPQLTTLNCRGTNIKTLDLKNCPHLDRLEVNEGVEIIQ